MHTSQLNIRKLLIAILAIVMSLQHAPTAGMAAPGAQSQVSGLRMEARAAFDGNFKYGEWLPIWVELENNGADIEAEVRVQITGGGSPATFIAPASLPSVSRKVIPIYVLPNNFSRELEVQLVSGDDLLASQTVTVRPQTNISYFIGLITPQRGALSLLSGISLPGQDRPKVLVDLSLEHLPDRLEGLRSFDTIVLNDTDTSSLTPAQGQALLNWVNQGGRLVIGGGVGLPRTLSGLPEALHPISSPDDTSLKDLSGLADFSEAVAIRVPGPFIVSTGEMASNQVLASQDGVTLVSESKLGSGTLDFIALDVSASPFDAWAGATYFWQKLLSPGAAYPEWIPRDISMRQERSAQMPYALMNLPVLDLPSTRTLAFLLGIYILLVGPVNYLALRWKKRMHWAWITIPLITGIFSASAFGIGYAMRGNDLIVNKISIISLQSGRDANVTSYVGLFSPGQTAYEIEVDGDGLLSPMFSYYDPWGSTGQSNQAGELVFIQGDPGKVRGLSISQWSLQSFMVEDTWQDFGEITSDLTLQDGKLVGQVRNNTPYELTDAVVILGKAFVRLGALAPGATSEVDLALDQNISNQFMMLSYRLFEEELNVQSPTGPPRAAELRRMLVEIAIERYGGTSKFPSTVTTNSPATLQEPLLLAWLNQAPPDVHVSDRQPSQQVTAMFYTRLSYHLPREGIISVPPGLLAGTVVEMPREAGMCGEPGTTAVYLVSGEAVFEYQIPAEMRDLDFEHLKLSVWTDGGWWSEPEMAIYDWQADAWEAIPRLQSGINEVGDAGARVSDTGLVRLRLQNKDGFQGCYYLALGFAANQPR